MGREKKGQNRGLCRDGGEEGERKSKAKQCVETVGEREAPERVSASERGRPKRGRERENERERENGRQANGGKEN